MFLHLFFREIMDKLISLRFALLIVVVNLIMVVGTIGYVQDYKESRAGSNKVVQVNEAGLRWAASEELWYVVNRKNIIPLTPRPPGLLIEGGERVIPNAMIFDSVKIYYPKMMMSTDSLIEQNMPMDWSFLVAVLLSFMAIALVYDTVSGGRADGSLQMCLANPVSRSTVILAKHAALLSLIVLAFVLSVLAGLLTANLAGLPVITDEFISIVIYWFFLSAAYLSVFVLMGILISIMTNRTSVSMLSLLLIWLLLTLIVPAGGILLCTKNEDIISTSEFAERTDTWLARARAEEQYGENDPMIGHKAGEIIKRETEDFWRNRIQRIKRARKITSFSPAQSYQVASEALVGVGLVRFERLLAQIPVYQRQLRQFIADADAMDPDSRHLYDPSNLGLDAWGLSRKPVPYEAIPQFEESTLTIIDAGKKVLWQLGYLLFLNLFLFALTWVAFLRADVRRGD